MDGVIVPLGNHQPKTEVGGGESECECRVILREQKSFIIWSTRTAEVMTRMRVREDAVREEAKHLESGRTRSPGGGGNGRGLAKIVSLQAHSGRLYNPHRTVSPTGNVSIGGFCATLPRMGPTRMHARMCPSRSKASLSGDLIDGYT